MKKKLILFDFDGTITTKDTLLEFVRFYRGKYALLTGGIVLSPILALHLFKLIKNWKAKQFFLSWYFKGEEVSVFNQRCHQFAKDKIPQLVRSQALNAIKQYQREGHTIAVVSASPENWVKPWCDQHGLTCLATRLEVKNEKITGNISGNNCYGPEKCSRISEQFALKEYEEIIAYGDSSGDKEMLDLAHQKFYRPFRD
jgi:phosphatidylglycerophosphatase C